MNSMNWKPAMERPRIAAKSAVRSSNASSVPRCHWSRGRGCKKQVTDQSRRSERKQVSKILSSAHSIKRPSKWFEAAQSQGETLIGVSLDSSAARPLPSRIHDVEYLVVSVQRVEPPGRELRAADSPAKRDHRLIDDHGLAVHRRMPG
jgi:hypothetical protein